MIDEQRLTELNELRKHIGNTPVYRFKAENGIEIFAKLEWMQFGQSVKSRPAFSMIEDALQNGKIRGNQSILDATSGNTGIALAFIGAKLGIPVTLCVPEHISPERKLFLKSAGANLIFTSKLESTDGAQIKAKELAASNDKFHYLDQYSNEANWKAHYNSTGKEIFEQTHGRVTHFISGLGTSGTFMGTARRLLSLNPKIRVISLQPDSPMHGLEGWKHMETAIVPPIYDSSFAHESRTVSTIEAYETIKKVAREEGWLLSPSSAANLAGAFQFAKELPKKSVIATILPDDSGRYMKVLDEIYQDEVK